MLDVWYYDDEGAAVGPLSLRDLKATLATLSNAKDILIWCDQFQDWRPAKEVPELNSQSLPPPLPPNERAILSVKRGDYDSVKRRDHFLSRAVGRISGVVCLLALIVYGGLFQHHSEPVANGPAAPQQEAMFCSIIEGATSAYRSLSEQWSAAREQKNGIMQQRLSAEMTSLYRTRNQDIFRLFEGTTISFENWLVVVNQIFSFDPSEAKLNFTFHPICSPATTIHADSPTTPSFVELLSQKRQDDRLMASGTFVQPFGKPAAAPTDPEKFEQSFTESGSMNEPEYSAVITILK